MAEKSASKTCQNPPFSRAKDAETPCFCKESGCHGSMTEVFDENGKIAFLAFVRTNEFDPDRIKHDRMEVDLEGLAL
jgi:hypothetical protein